MADPESNSEVSVMSNDDLLTQILVRLPVLSLVLFKSVSKHWSSLIEHAISLIIINHDNLTFRRNLDPPSGLFLKKLYGTFSYDFVPFDIRIPDWKSSYGDANFNFFETNVRGRFLILDSCNGLLLCCGIYTMRLYVNNPSVSNMFKVLPKHDDVTYSYCSYMGGFKLAFDPSKSPHYKVINSKRVDDTWVQIRTYSSETGNWNLCGHQFPRRSFDLFRTGVYWNDGIYWLNDDLDEFFKLDFMNEDPVLVALRIPLTLYKDVGLGCRLFESRGSLLLVGKDDAHARHFTIYEKRNEYSEWSLKYVINLDNIIKPSPERWNIWRVLLCIILGEREEDSFVVMDLDTKVVQYNIMSKTLNTISEIGPNDGLESCFPFIPSFANV